MKTTTNEATLSNPRAELATMRTTREARATANAARERTYYHARDLWDLIDAARRIGAAPATIDAITADATEAARMAGEAHRAYAALDSEHAGMIAEALTPDERHALGLAS